MASINDIGTPGQPLDTPPLTGWQAAVRDVLGSDTPVNARAKATMAVKAADQAGIASGGSSGLTATLTGVRVGQIILAVVTSAFTVPAAATSYTNLTPTGLTPVTVNPVAPCTGNTTVSNQTVVAVYTATATTVSVGYSMTHSTSAAWTCKGQSSVALIAI